MSTQNNLMIVIGSEKQLRAHIYILFIYLFKFFMAMPQVVFDEFVMIFFH
jgi:hypothetical protein